MSVPPFPSPSRAPDHDRPPVDLALGLGPAGLAAAVAVALRAGLWASRTTLPPHDDVLSVEAPTVTTLDLDTGRCTLEVPTTWHARHGLDAATHKGVLTVHGRIHLDTGGLLLVDLDLDPASAGVVEAWGVDTHTADLPPRLVQGLQAAWSAVLPILPSERLLWRAHPHRAAVAVAETPATTRVVPQDPPSIQAPGDLVLSASTPGLRRLIRVFEGWDRLDLSARRDGTWRIQGTLGDDHPGAGPGATDVAGAVLDVDAALSVRGSGSLGLDLTARRGHQPVAGHALVHDLTTRGLAPTAGPGVLAAADAGAPQAPPPDKAGLLAWVPMHHRDVAAHHRLVSGLGLRWVQADATEDGVVVTARLRPTRRHAPRPVRVVAVRPDAEAGPHGVGAIVLGPVDDPDETSVLTVPALRSAAATGALDPLCPDALAAAGASAEQVRGLAALGLVADRS